MRRQPFILLSFSSSKKLRKAQETQSYQRIQCIGHTDFNTSGTNGSRSLSQVKAGTHSAFRERSHTAAHTPKQGAFRMGGGITTLGPFRTFTNIPGPGIRTAYFAAFGSWSGVLPKNAESLGTATRISASLSRGVAALPGCVIFSVSVEIAACTPCAQCFLCVRGGGGITTPGVLCVLLKHSAPACQKGSFAVF